MNQIKIEVEVPKNVDRLIREICKLDGSDVADDRPYAYKRIGISA